MLFNPRAITSYLGSSVCNLEDASNKRFIKDYCGAEAAQKAIGVYCWCKLWGLKLRQIGLDEKTVTFGLKSCTELRNFLSGKGMHADSLKLGLSRNKFVGCSLVGLYSKLARMDESQKAFEEILDKDIVSYTSMITGYCENVDSTSWNAFEIASDMLRSNLEANRVTLVSLLQVCGNLGAIREAYQLASAVLKNLKQSVASWNAMLAGLTQTGQSRNAIHYFSVMLHEHKAVSELGHLKGVKQIHCFVYRTLLEKDTKTTNSLITAYAKCGRLDLSVVDDSVYSVIPQQEHYGCIVDLLSRAGHLEEGYKLIKLSTLKDKSSVLCALLSACTTHGNTMLGQIIGDELLEFEQQNPGTYALVSDVFAQKGQWTKSANIRNRAKESGLRKLPGSSLIESVEEANNLR
ncbi:hypothetical protein HU200_010109 [Digitaria exilis]|uniref:Pentatricopeptide repeat-containing protein n=1 Tax=Digitaria exilis TaxID=1010633 RepID=A0A835FI15_9POAL|nr:hypothetical protein HU200_010109 [Digitaria exilis]